MYHFWARWKLPTCSNMPYTTMIPWPLEASRGPDEPPKQCFRGVPGVMLSRCIPSGHSGRFQPARIRHTQLTFPQLPVWFGLQRPPEAFRGPHEPQSVFSRCPQCCIIVIDHFWPRWTLPTCSNVPYTTFIPSIVCLVWPEASRAPNEPT